MLTHLAPKPVVPARVVILGARGFLATHLRTWCARHGVSNLPLSGADVDLESDVSAGVLADILRPDDVVVMTAIVSPDKGRGHESFLRNVRMVDVMCRALGRAPCAHVLYLSSDAVYDGREVPLDERATREPTSLYALSHTAREMVLASALALAGIPLCVLRLTAIYGPGDTHGAYGPNRFVRSALLHGRIELFGEGEELRSHVFVEDAVEVIGRTILRRSIGTVNVAAEPAVTFASVAGAVAQVVGGGVRVEHVPRAGGPASPVVHRPFGNAALLASFPGFAFTALERGLDVFVAAERSRLSTGSARGLAAAKPRAGC
jgi:UDP-glucose 4-epimerase